MPSTPPRLKKVFLTPMRRKYSIRSSPLTSFPLMTLIYLLFSIAPLAVAPPLTSPLLSPLSLCLILGGATRPGFKSPTNSTNLPSFYGLSPQQTSSFLQIFRKLVEMTLFFTLTLTVFLQRNTRLTLLSILLPYSSLSSSYTAALFTSLTPNVAKSSIRFGRIKRLPKA